MPRHLLYRRPPTRRRVGDLRGQQPGVLVPVHAGFREGLQSLEPAGVQVTHPLSRGIDPVISLHAEPPRGSGLNVPGEQDAYARRRSFRHSSSSSGTSTSARVRPTGRASGGTAPGACASAASTRCRGQPGVGMDKGGQRARPVRGALDSGGGPIREPVDEPGPAARAVRPDVPSGGQPAGRAIHADSLTPSRYAYKAPAATVTIRLGG